MHFVVPFQHFDIRLKKLRRESHVNDSTLLIVHQREHSVLQKFSSICCHLVPRQAGSPIILHILIHGSTDCTHHARHALPVPQTVFSVQIISHAVNYFKGNTVVIPNEIHDIWVFQYFIYRLNSKCLINAFCVKCRNPSFPEHLQKAIKDVIMAAPVTDCRNLFWFQPRYFVENFRIFTDLWN